MDMKKGCTLIEIMVVIAIIGTLMTMAAGSYIASMKKGRDLKRKSDIVQIGKALEVYYADNGRYPAAYSGSIAACGSSFNDPCSWGESSLVNKTDPGVLYMAQLPKDPKGQTYYYDSDGEGTYYQLYAKLENTDDKDNYDYDILCGSGNCSYGSSSTNVTPTFNRIIKTDETPPPENSPTSSPSPSSVPTLKPVPSGATPITTGTPPMTLPSSGPGLPVITPTMEAI